MNGLVKGKRGAKTNEKEKPLRVPREHVQSNRNAPDGETNRLWSDSLNAEHDLS